MEISVVSPVYMAENIISELVKRISEELRQITTDFEIILVEDCGPDNSWEIIKQQCEQYPFVKGIKLSRNFGQHSAIKAGLEHVTGDCCIVMDCDLQDDPKYIKDLVLSWKSGHEIVYTYKDKRRHSIFKNFTTSLFNLILNFLVDNATPKVDKNIGSYSLISRKVIEAFKSYNDYQFHYLMVLRWLGFKEDFLEIEHQERFEGKSSYSFKKLFEHAIVGVVFQSDKLLRISIYIGFLFSILSLIFILVIIVKYFLYGFQPGWASLVIIILFSTGLILMSIGVLGLYIAKIFEQVKSRPQYVVDKKINI